MRGPVTESSQREDDAEDVLPVDRFLRDIEEYDGVSQLREIVADMRQAAAAGNRELTARLDIAFHTKLYDLAPAQPV